MNTVYTFEVLPRPEAAGGGWRLYLFEDGEEVGGGIFEPGDDGYSDAWAEGNEWLTSRQ